MSITNEVIVQRLNKLDLKIAEAERAGLDDGAVTEYRQILGLLAHHYGCTYSNPTRLVAVGSQERAKERANGPTLR